MVLLLYKQISMCKFFATPFLGAVPHRDKDYYGIRSNFWKLYLIRIGFTLCEPVLWVKVFRLFRLERVFFGVRIALDPAFGSFTLLESVSPYVNRFYWWMCLDCLDWNGFFLGVQSVDTVGRCMYNILAIGRFVMPCFFLTKGMALFFSSLCHVNWQNM